MECLPIHKYATGVFWAIISWAAENNILKFTLWTFSQMKKT